MKFYKKKWNTKLVSKPNKKHKRTKMKPVFNHSHSKLPHAEEKGEPEKLLHFCTCLLKSVVSLVCGLMTRGMIVLGMILIACLRVMTMCTQEKNRVTGRS